MGSEMSRSVRSWRARRMRRIVLVGLDNAGKTTLVRQLAKQDPSATQPTVEAAYCETQYKRWTLLLTDVGGQEALRPYWRHHFTGAQGVVFVVDSCDRERLAAAKAELRVMLVDSQLKGVPVVIFANKQDLAGAAPVDEVERLVLGEAKGVGEHEVTVVGGSVLSSDGLFEALDWLTANMPKV